MARWKRLCHGQNFIVSWSWRNNYYVATTELIFGMMEMVMSCSGLYCHMVEGNGFYVAKTESFHGKMETVMSWSGRHNYYVATTELIYGKIEMA